MAASSSASGARSWPDREAVHEPEGPSVHGPSTVRAQRHSESGPTAFGDRDAGTHHESASGTVAARRRPSEGSVTMSLDVSVGRLPDPFLPLPALGEAAARAEAERCLYCFDAPCSRACPTGIDVPSFIRKIATRNLEGSARTILAANPLGGTCGAACPVERLCEEACVRASLDRPIAIGRAAATRDRCLRGDGQGVLHAGARRGCHGRDRRWRAGGTGLRRRAATRRRRGHGLRGPRSRGRAGRPRDRPVAPAARDRRDRGRRGRAGGCAVRARRGRRSGRGPGRAARRPRRGRRGHRAWRGQAARDSRRDARRRHRRARPRPARDRAGPDEGSARTSGGGHRRRQHRVRRSRRGEAPGCGRSDAVLPAQRRRGPAYPHAIELARSLGVTIQWLAAPVEIHGERHVTGVAFERMALGEPDATGRRRPEPIAGSRFEVELDTIVRAAGQEAPSGNRSRPSASNRPVGWP